MGRSPKPRQRTAVLWTPVVFWEGIINYLEIELEGCPLVLRKLE